MSESGGFRREFSNAAWEEEKRRVRRGPPAPPPPPRPRGGVPPNPPPVDALAGLPVTGRQCRAVATMIERQAAEAVAQSRCEWCIGVAAETGGVRDQQWRCGRRRRQLVHRDGHAVGRLDAEQRPATAQWLALRRRARRHCHDAKRSRTTPTTTATPMSAQTGQSPSNQRNSTGASSSFWKKKNASRTTSTSSAISFHGARRSS